MKTIIQKALVAVVLLGPAAGAATSNWTGLGGNNDFNNAANWSNGVPGTSNDYGTFNLSVPIGAAVSANTTLGGLIFSNGASATTIVIPTSKDFQMWGSGITNNSSNTQTLDISGTAEFNFSASAGNAKLQTNIGGNLYFFTLASAGSSTITNSGGQTNFINSATAANATIINNTNGATGGVTVFSQSATAGNASITSNFGTVQFNDTSSAENATLTSLGSTIQFNNRSTAGNADITIQSIAGIPPTFGSANFLGNSSAGNSTFTIINSQLFLSESATAGSSLFNNIAGGAVRFSGNSLAGYATINNTNSGATGFSDFANADHAIINDNATTSIPYTTFFSMNSSAGSASIFNNTGLSKSTFLNLATASSSTITNTNGSADFKDASTAAQSIITNNNGRTTFFDVSNAGQSVITNNGATSVVQFNNVSTAGQATITNNGGAFIQFNDTTNGGSSTIINTSGTVDVSNLSSQGLSMGSIAGAGTFLLGSKNLTVGNNGLSTTVSGAISGSGGSIVKVGTGTLALSGTNTYTGGTTINSGTLAIANNNSLGSASGSLTIAGGAVLQTNGAINSARTVTLIGGGYVDTNGFNSSLSGTIQGPGALVKTGQGTLTVSGSNTYSGGTAIDEGILKIGSNNALPGGTSVVLADTAGAALDLNGFNQTIGSLVGGGSSGGNVILGTATLTTGTDNSSTQYGGVISGSGSVVKVGTGTLVLAEGNTYTGDTTVNGGNLVFIEANPGASQTASVGSIGNLHNNSAVTPGINGIGVLHVTNYSGPGALNISFNGPNHTALLVDGNASLTGGKLNLIGSRFSTGQYDIITAGSITGTFEDIGIPASSVFLNMSTEYTPTAVQINITSLNFVDVAETGNQQTVAAALDADRTNASGDFDAALQAIFALPTAAQARAAYNQISGDSLASFQNAGLRSADVFTRQMSERSGTTTSSGITQAMAPIQLAYAGDLAQSNIDLKAPAKETVPAYGLWSRGLGFIDNVDANASVGSPSSKSTTGGFQAGYDFQVADDVLLGLSGGYAKTSLSVDDRSSSGNSTSVQSGIYASYTPGPWFVNGSLAYTTSSNDMTRTIQFIGVNEQASASFQSRVYTTYVEGGYQYKLRRNSAVEPTISLKHSRLTQEAFTESGAPGLNLSVEDQTVNSIVSALGARITHHFRPTTNHPMTLGVRAAWEHELGDTDNKITSQFAEAPLGGTFTTQATPRSRNAAAIGLDGRVTLTQNLQAFLDYSATLGSGQNTQGLFGGVSVRW